MKPFPPWTTVPALLLALTLAAPAAATELLENRSIEQYHGYALPPSWLRLAGTGASVVNEDPAFASAGRNSLEFDLSLGNNPEWNHVPFAVRPGEVLEASLKLRVDEAFTSGHCAALVRWWSGPNRAGFLGQVAIADNIGVSTTAGWQQATLSTTVPADAAFADVTVWGNGIAFGPAGVARFDEFSLRVAPSPGAATTAPAPANGEDAVQIYRVLQATTAVPSPKAARLYLGEDRLALLDADESSVLLLDEFPIAAGDVRYGVTLKPYRRYFWRMDVLDASDTWRRGDTWSFSTGFHVVEDAVSVATKRFDTKDSRNLRVDALQVIKNPDAAGYIGTYHNIPLNDGQFDLQVGTSTNLLSWTFRATLEPNADMGALQHMPATGGYVLAHEQWGNPFSTSPSNLRFRHYLSTADLLAGNDARSFTAPISAFNPSNLEGTPNLYNVSPDGNDINVGFHYFNAPVDRLATGRLHNLVSGTTTWSAQVQGDRNDMLIAMDVVANIGDRHALDLYGSRYILQEGQYVVNDFGSWRGFFFDEERGRYFPLFLRTPLGSRAHGNMTATYLPLPGGGRGVVASYFIFSEQAQPGEPGQLVFFHTLAEEPAEPTPSLGATAPTSIPRLRWLGGAGNVQWDVYLSTSSAEVNAADPSSPAWQGVVGKPQWQAPPLQGQTTYFWRVDGIQHDGTRSRGPVWSFNTPVATDGRHGMQLR